MKTNFHILSGNKPLMIEGKENIARIITDTGVLARKSQPIDEIDDDIRELATVMRHTMYDAQGIGLAAIQLGVTKQMITVDIQDSNGLLTLINPKVISGKGKVHTEEGCLSYPNILMRVKRRKSVVVQAYNLNGELVTINAEGLLAICLQHEIDHVNGVSFMDKTEALWRAI